MSPASRLLAKSVSERKPRCERREDIVIGALIDRSNHFSVTVWISLYFVGISDVNYLPVLCSLDEWNCPKGRFVEGPVDLMPHGFLLFTSNDSENVPALVFVPSGLRADITVPQVDFPEAHRLCFQRLEAPFTCLDPISALICI